MIGILDYSAGNLGSVVNACRYLALDARVVASPRDLAGCHAMILPGQGAFGDCMSNLRKAGFEEPVKEWIAAGRPFFGICVGLQALYDGSEESPGVPGLSLFRGTIRRFDGGPDRKVPQIGWNRVAQARRECPLFHGVPNDAFFYFVHSFYAEDGGAEVAGRTEYGVEYASVVWRDNLMAVQFHPEKSQKVGLMMFRNFADWAYERTAAR